MKHLKPITNASRNTVLMDNKTSSLVKKYPKNLFKKLKSHSGRNNQGVITTRHQGGGHKKIYRIIDFKRYSKDGISGTVKSIEYDPYRNCFISFISYLNGTSSFILSPNGLKIGDKVISKKDYKKSDRELFLVTLFVFPRRMYYLCKSVKEIVLIIYAPQWSTRNECPLFNLIE